MTTTSTDRNPTTESTRCKHGACQRRGELHPWGYGFRFCKTHMPTMIALEHGRLTARRKLGRVAKCHSCGDAVGIKGRGLCSLCYRRHADAGTLEHFDRQRWGTARKD